MRGLKSISDIDFFKRFNAELITNLEMFGLDEDMIKLYLTILSKKPLTASAISSMIDMDRTKTYRRVDKLLNLGLIETTFDNPRRMIPVNPKIAFLGLVNRSSMKLKDLESIKDNTIEELSSIEVEHNSVLDHISIIQGRYNIYGHIQSRIREAEKSVIIMSDEKDLLFMNHHGVSDTLNKKINKGITAIIITNAKNKKNLKYFKCDIILNTEIFDSRIVLIDSKVLFMSGELTHTRYAAQHSSEVALNIKNNAIAGTLLRAVKLISKIDLQ